MNKVKMFFVAAALLLTTAGVFAGKAKFAGVANAYFPDNTIIFQNATSSHLYSTGTTAASLNGTRLYGGTSATTPLFYQ
jgi:hypothetical protein